MPGVVGVLALGGTIAMSRDDTANSDETTNSVVPTLTANDLVAGLGSACGVDIEARTIVNRPGASLTIGDLFTLVDTARRLVDDGALGVVVTQGTDTMEETAFILDLLWDRSAPLVVTGAMRNPTQLGADGPANLAAAIQVATSSACRGVGCVVVMNDEIHAARYVRKEHSTSPAAFRSPGAAKIGSVQEGRARLWMSVPRHHWMPTRLSGPLARVALVEATFDDEGGLLAPHVLEPFQGVVIAGFGVGHLSAVAAEAAIAAAVARPVVLASRCGAGGTLTGTYGFVGSESHLLSNGLISAGRLDARKARLLLVLLLTSGVGRDTVVRIFSSFDEMPLVERP